MTLGDEDANSKAVYMVADVENAVEESIVDSFFTADSLAAA